MRRVEMFELIPAPRGAESPSGLEDPPGGRRSGRKKPRAA